MNCMILLTMRLRCVMWAGREPLSTWKLESRSLAALGSPGLVIEKNCLILTTHRFLESKKEEGTLYTVH